MAITRVRGSSNGNADTSSGTCAITFGGAVAAGNLVIAYCSAPFGETVDAISDSGGNTWTVVAASDIRSHVYWSKITTGGTLTITFTFSGAGEATGHLIGVIEFSGNAAASIFGGSSYAAIANAFSFDSGNVTTDTADALLVGFEFGAIANISLDGDYFLEADTLVQGYRFSYKPLTSTGTHSQTNTSVGEEDENLFLAWFRGASGTNTNYAPAARALSMTGQAPTLSVGTGASRTDGGLIFAPTGFA